MIFVIAFVMTALAVLVQSMVFPYLALAGVVPNLAVACIVSFSYQRGHKFGLLLGFCSGLLIDLLFSSTIGLEALILMTVGVACIVVEKIEIRHVFFFSLTVIGLGDFLYGTLYYLIHFMLQGKMSFSTYLVKVILPEMFYTVACGFVVYLVIRAVCRWYRRFEFREE